MKLARILYPVWTLGPGRRVGIWTCGCDRQCPGCANPELWDAGSYGDLAVADVIRTIQELERRGYGRPEGVTITGGEPFSQKEELSCLVEALQKITDDILLYTGFLREELLAWEDAVIGRVAVLVDGPYLEERNDEHPLKGSENQRIHYIRPEFRERYEEYIRGMEGRRLAQNFSLREGRACVGIHGADFRRQYEQRRSAYGDKGEVHQ